MILLDTHIWIWLVHDDSRLVNEYRDYLAQKKAESWGVSIISCWEIAKLVEYDRLDLRMPVDEWLEGALAPTNIHLISLTPEICVESTQLPAGFHRDPADQMIVATARILDCPLVTMDLKIRDYAHVRVKPS